MDLGDLLPQLEGLVDQIGERHLRDALLDIIETGRDMWRKSTVHISSTAHWHDAAHALCTHLTQLGDPHARLVSSHATFVDEEYLGTSARAHHAAVGTSLAALDRHTRTLTASAAAMHQIGDHFDNAQGAQEILGLACGGLVLALGSAVLTGGADLEISLPGAALACADGAAAATIASELAAADADERLLGGVDRDESRSRAG